MTRCRRSLRGGSSREPEEGRLWLLPAAVRTQIVATIAAQDRWERINLLHGGSCRPLVHWEGTRRTGERNGCELMPQAPVGGGRGAGGGRRSHRPGAGRAAGLRRRVAGGGKPLDGNVIRRPFLTVESPAIGPVREKPADGHLVPGLLVEGAECHAGRVL